jgi:hypothetical protein
LSEMYDFFAHYDQLIVLYAYYCLSKFAFL